VSFSSSGMSQRRNEQLVELLSADFCTRDPWRDWTPTLTQGVAVGCTISSARLWVMCNTVTLGCRLAVTGAGTAGSPIIVHGIPLPPAFASSYQDRGGGGVWVAASNIPRGGITLLMSGGVTARFREVGLADYLGVTAVTLANGDAVYFTVTYERA
jgi:hypothetical protein